MAPTPMFLRVEEPDGRTVAEYRIRDEAIEVRHPPFSTQNEDEWYRLTAEDLTSHVSRNTAVAQWLTRRLGWRRLLRACVGEQSLHHFDRVDSATDRRPLNAATLEASDMSGSHVIRYSRLRRGEYYADFRRDEQQTPEVYHCVIQRDGSPEVLWWSQFNSLLEATRVVEKRLRCLSDDRFESAA